MALLDELAAREAAMRWLDERTQLGAHPMRHLQASAARRRAGHSNDLDPKGQEPPYEDVEGPDGLIRYADQGQDPDHSDNQALRRAYEQQLPLIWFVAIADAVYLARYPVYVVADEPKQLRVALAISEDQRFMGVPGVEDVDRRRTVQRLTNLRLHQPVFRAQVLGAYERSCAMCRLKHVELLDAAHIIPDGKERGTPIVPNGLSLCSIHHR